MVTAKKLKTGGSVLVEKYGKEYFSNLSKAGWAKRKEANRLYELSLKKKKK